MRALPPSKRIQLLSELSEADKELAAMLVKRDSFNLAASLEGLLGSKAFSHYIFGIGVVGMALSTIIILMTINGHAVCEVLGNRTKAPLSWERSLRELAFWAHSFGAMQLFGSRCLPPLLVSRSSPLAYLSFSSHK